MNTTTSYEVRRQLMWGLVLIGIGAVFLFERMDLIEDHALRHYWPWLLVAFGVNKMIGYPSVRHLASGFWMVCVGLWLYAVFDHLFGLTFNNSWPFLVIAFGVQKIMEALLGGRAQANKEYNNEK